MLSFVALLALAAPNADAPDVIVVCPKEYRTALAPWVKHRTTQGHAVEVIDSTTADSVRAKICSIAAAGKLKHVVLVGDADVPRNQGVTRAHVPTFKQKAEVNVKFGSEPDIATDNPYADVDDDGIPDLAVGRLSVDSPAQLTEVVRKILDYETRSTHGPWRNKVDLVAGVGGFGSLIDGTIEMMAKKFLCDGVPTSYDTSMTYGSWQSPYCPDPRRFQDAVLDRFNQGSLFWVYMGHGHPERLDRVHVPNAAYPILEHRDIPRLDCQNGKPIAVMLACYTGAYDYPRECLAEEMLRHPGGPVATFAGSRVTMPYAMAVLSNALIEETFKQRPKTLGELVLQAKRKSVAKVEPIKAVDGEPAPEIDSRHLLDALGRLLSPRPDLLDAERKEHLALFNLLGDPLLRIAYPDEVKLEMPDEVPAGTSLPLKITSPVAGRCTVQLVCRRDCLTFEPPSREEFQPQSEWLDELHKIYLKANDHRFGEHVVEITPGQFEADLPVPESARGPCHVRVFIEGKEQHAVGAANVYVRKK